MTFSVVQPIFSEAASAGTLFLFTVFGDKKSKSLRGSSGINSFNKKTKNNKPNFERFNFEGLIMVVEIRGKKMKLHTPILNVPTSWDL